MAFCIPKHVSEKLLRAAKEGAIDMVQLYNMNSDQRRTFFQTYTTKENAEGINAGFEAAMASKQKEALTKWVDSIYNPSQKKKGAGLDVVDRVNALKADDLIGEGSQAFYQDLVSTRLGVTVTQDEMAEITKRADKMSALMETTNKFGLPSEEYWVAKREMQKYLYSLQPSSDLKVLSSTIARGTLLFSFKSPLTNIVGNSVQGIVESVNKRIASGTFGGANPGLMKEYLDYANKVYAKSGYDVTRMITTAEDSKLVGEEIVHSEGTGAVKFVGRAYEDLIFKRLLGAPDVAFSAASFGDTANIMSTKIAQKEGLKGEAIKTRAAELFRDATSIEPKTLDGELIRAQAMADAQYATFTNDSAYSTFALGIRKLFNIASGDLRIGDQIMPFVKTPANVIGAGLDAAGLAAIKSVIDLPNAINEFRDGNTAPMQSVTRGFVRSGLGLTLAFILSSLFKPEDFIGEYPTTEKERQLLEEQNASPNSLKIKVGGQEKWVSLDYFGPIGAPLVGMLYARKYGKGLPDTIFRYGQGVATQSVKIPGFNEFYDTVKGLKDARPDKSKGLSENLQGMGGFALDFMRSRVIPAIVYDYAKGSDTYERKVNPKSAIQKAQSGIPGLRQQLPIDKTVTGQDRKTESMVSTLLFGSRVKTARVNATVNELNRLDSTGNLPSITDVEKTSTRVKEFSSQVSPEKFRTFMDDFSVQFGKGIEKEIATPRYKRLDDEKRADSINKLKDSLLEKTLKKHGYKKPKKK